MIRLALFLGALAVVFGGAAALGRAVGPTERDANEEEVEHVEKTPHTAPAPVGLALAANGFRFVAGRTRFTPGERVTFSFRIAGAREFEPTHERLMHLVVARRDLDYFQHLHPTRAADGSWTVELALPAPGAYRAFADFSADGKRTVLGLDLIAVGEWQPGRSVVAGTGRNHVTMTRDGERLDFRVTREGEPVEVERYLGARGHLVVLRDGDLAYVHTHADEDELSFEAPLPSPGRYRAYLQFSVGGTVHTKSFDLEQR